MLTADDAADIPVPDQPYSFGAFKNAQAIGDQEVLQRNSRRVLRIHLGPDIRGGLVRLRELVQTALAAG